MEMTHDPTPPHATPRRRRPENGRYGNGRPRAAGRSPEPTDRSAGTRRRALADGGVSWTDLTGFQRDLLRSLRRIDEDRTVPTGRTVKDEVESMYGEPINHGRLYANLNELAERDCVEKVVVDGRTNAYYLTEASRRLLDAAARDLVEACEIRPSVSET